MTDGHRMTDEHRMTGRHRILIADDEPSFRRLYEHELRKAGYEVELASSGKEVLQRVQVKRPDLVILDIRMPGMNGLDTMNRLLEEDNELPVIINSAYPNFRDSYMSWSADAYLVKSSDLSELKRTIREVLETRSVCP